MIDGDAGREPEGQEGPFITAVDRGHDAGKSGVAERTGVILEC